MVRKPILTAVIMLTLSIGIIGCGYETLPEGQYTLSISSSRAGYVSRPGEGVFVYDNGTVVELVANAVGNSSFVEWTGDVDTIANVRAVSTTITMDDDYSIRANFEGAGGCFIATAAYGTGTTEEMQILRDFRNEYLFSSSLGQCFVDVYYTLSPPMADFITEHPSLKPIVRAGLVPVVAMCGILLDIVP